MKKKKLDLEKLKVTSFVTAFDDADKQTIVGGKTFKSVFKKCGGGDDGPIVIGPIGGSQIVCSASGVCICKSEDCETEVLCEPSNFCPPTVVL